MLNVFRVLAVAILLCAITTPALSISVGYSSGSGGDSVSSSTTYSLDDSTSLQEQSLLGESGIIQTASANGKGSNYINHAMTSGESSTNNVIASTGSFATTSSSSASQGVVSSNQNVAMNGNYGNIASSSSSPENEMTVSGGFSGDDGVMSANLNAVSSDTAMVSGDASLMGIPVLNDENLQTVGSDDIGMTVDGLYESKGNLGSFGLSTVNQLKKSGVSTNALLTGPVMTSDGGRSSAYTLLGFRWNTQNPQIKFYVKDDANLRNEGLSPTTTANAINSAANTWDDATNQNLFSDTGVTVSSAVNSDTYDRKNVAAWKYLSSAPSALAYSRTWYSYSKVGGYYSAVESDLSFNTRYGWATNGRNYDVQTTALHELGHTIGLGDLYGKSAYTQDTRQIMHYYTGVKRTLGNGDKTGAWLLYH